MRLVTFSLSHNPASPRVGVWLSGSHQVLELGGRGSLPNDMLAFIAAGPAAWETARSVAESRSTTGYHLSEVRLHAPLLRPNSLRDFYAFEQHVATAHANRGRTVPPEWYEFPVFYFSNPFSVYGPDEDVPRPCYTEALDYELEVAAIIGAPGKDIQPEHAMQHIFGFTVFNDWSARDVQRREMKVGLGPAKGKDFASSFGPCIVTPDELAARQTGRPGVYDLTMTARVNGAECSRGNWKDIHYDFGQIVARASEEVMLYPGDVIGSGTVGTGCLLETTRGEGPWLVPGDVVELEIENIGTLKNRVV
ncbi:MAG: fumarylacetoacetate hydrolase family protein [Chloroflexi bacterium]|nr:fumarylacetoacetate hydrolase family protein [Chloroflexota bacterium]